MSDGGRRLRQLLLSKYWEFPKVLRGFPTQREVTRCGWNRSARVCTSCLLS